MTGHVHDVVAIGAGPFNLGLAALADPVDDLDVVVLEAREEVSWHPGMLLDDATLDHNVAASTGGATSHENLAAFCRRHHMLKHHSPWHVEQRPGGVLEWTSPMGRTYIDRPPAQNTVTFTDAGTVAVPF